MVNKNNVNPGKSPTPFQTCPSSPSTSHAWGISDTKLNSDLLRPSLFTEVVRRVQLGSRDCLRGNLAADLNSLLPVDQISTAHVQVGYTPFPSMW